VLSSGVSSGAKPATPVQTVSATSKKENVVQQVSSKDGAYTLQIGSFSTHARAKILADQYEEAWIARIDVNGEVSFRVYFSRFDQEKPARIAQNDLWTKGQDSFLRKVAS
jgi:cell division protein FtsN